MCCAHLYDCLKLNDQFKLNLVPDGYIVLAHISPVKPLIYVKLKCHPFSTKNDPS
jgi:hypothetical protein